MSDGSDGNSNFQKRLTPEDILVVLKKQEDPKTTGEIGTYFPSFSKGDFVFYLTHIFFKI